MTASNQPLAEFNYRKDSRVFRYIFTTFITSFFILIVIAGLKEILRYKGNVKSMKTRLLWKI